MRKLKQYKRMLRVFSLFLMCTLFFYIIPGVSATPIKSAAEWEDSFSTTAGDLSSEQLSKVSLTKSSLPEGIDYNEAVQAGHKIRLYEQEPNLNTVIFQNADASKTMYTFYDAVKYIKEDGTIQDIDNEIITQPKNEQYAFRNKSSDVQLEFGRRLPQGLKMRYDDMQISMKANDALTVAPVTDSTTVTYPEAFGKGTELRYTPTLKGMKEEIILEEYTGQNVFRFNLDIGEGHEITTLDDDCLYIVNSQTQEVLALISPVWIFDAEDKLERNNELEYQQNEDGTWELIITANSEFLLDEETVYPVCIDPTISVVKSSYPTGINDVTLYSNTAKPSAGNSGSLFVGNRSGFGYSRVLMKFPGLSMSGITQASQITSVKVSLRDLMCESEELEIGCYAFTGNTWTDSTAGWTTVSPNSYSTSDGALKKVSFAIGDGLGPEYHRYYFDITNIAKKWVTGAYNKDKGVIFKSTNESLARFKTFSSYDRDVYNPTVVMTYTAVTPPASRTIADGDYYIRNLYSMKFLDLHQSNAIHWALHGDTNQIWRVTFNSAGGYYTIVPKADTGKRLVANGTNAEVGTSTGAASQWKITSVANGVYKLTYGTTTMALTVPLSSVTGDAGNNVSVSSYSNSSLQQWEFVKKCVNGKDFCSDASIRLLKNDYNVLNALDWQATEIHKSMDAWNSRGAAAGIKFTDTKDSFDVTLNAQAHISEAETLGRFNLIERTIDLSYTNIVNHVESKSEGVSETIKNSRVQTTYGETATHEMGHALGLLDNPPGSGKGADGLTTEYTIMRYPSKDGKNFWESYWAVKIPRYCDIVGAAHPEA